MKKEYRTREVTGVCERQEQDMFWEESDLPGWSRGSVWEIVRDTGKKSG